MRLIGVLVVTAMGCGPPERPLLDAGGSQKSDDELHQPRRLVGAVGEVAVVAGRDDEHPSPVEGESDDE